MLIVSLEPPWRQVDPAGGVALLANLSRHRRSGLDEDLVVGELGVPDRARLRQPLPDRLARLRRFLVQQFRHRADTP